MSLGLKYVLDKRRKKKDGTHALRLRVTISRKMFELSSGYSLLEVSWDDKRQLVKKSAVEFQNTTRINNLLSVRRAEVFDKLAKLDEEGALNRLSLQEIKGHITGKKKIDNVYIFIQSVIDEMKLAGSIGNARVYDMVLRSIKKFSEDKDFAPKNINYSWLKRYEAWYLGKDNSMGKSNSINGLGVNLRTIRAVINRAIKQKLLSKDCYPFSNYSIKKEATRKRAISREDLVRLMTIEPQTERQKRAKRYFFISYYLMGASFIDIAFLTFENVQNGRIEYKRRKTGRLHSIKISERLFDLLEPYLSRDNATSNDFILPILTKDQTLEEQYVAARDEMRRYNKALKVLGEKAKLSIPLTSYVARHSYATIAKYQGMPTALISEALGHTTEEVTQVYLDSFDKNVLDDWNERVQSV